jgi:hypothetical protein
MDNARIVGFLWVAATAGCSLVHAPPPPRASTPPSPTEIAAPTAAKPAASAASQPAAPTPAKPAAPVAAKPAAPVAAKPAAPSAPQPAPLDLASLERQLKDTKAIGVMTKIAIKNQVDDLLAQFRAYYEGRQQTSLAELRRPYELLVLKLLSLVQDADPALARAIHDSREAIWGILSDRARFSKLQS